MRPRSPWPSTTPPPQEMIRPLRLATSAMISVSASLNASSPFERMKSGAGMPCLLSNSRSISMCSRPPSSARRSPTRVFPQPGMPIKAIFSTDRDSSSVTCMMRSIDTVSPT